MSTYEDLKAAGKAALAAKKPAAAAASFQASAEAADTSSDRATGYTNAAIAWAKAEQWTKVLTCAERSLAAAPNVKGMYWKARAQLEARAFTEALNTCNEAVRAGGGSNVVQLKAQVLAAQERAGKEAEDIPALMSNLRAALAAADKPSCTTALQALITAVHRSGASAEAALREGLWAVLTEGAGPQQLNSGAVAPLLLRVAGASTWCVSQVLQAVAGMPADGLLVSAGWRDALLPAVQAAITHSKPAQDADVRAAVDRMLPVWRAVLADSADSDTVALACRGCHVALEHGYSAAAMAASPIPRALMAHVSGIQDEAHGKPTHAAEAALAALGALGKGLPSGAQLPALLQALWEPVMLTMSYTGPGAEDALAVFRAECADAAEAEADRSISKQAERVIRRADTAATAAKKGVQLSAGEAAAVSEADLAEAKRTQEDLKLRAAARAKRDAERLESMQHMQPGSAVELHRGVAIAGIAYLAHPAVAAEVLRRPCFQAVVLAALLSPRLATQLAALDTAADLVADETAGPSYVATASGSLGMLASCDNVLVAAAATAALAKSALATRGDSMSHMVSAAQARIKEGAEKEAAELAATQAAGASHAARDEAILGVARQATKCIVQVVEGLIQAQSDGELHTAWRRQARALQHGIDALAATASRTAVKADLIAHSASTDGPLTPLQALMTACTAADAGARVIPDAKDVQAASWTAECGGSATLLSLVYALWSCAMSVSSQRARALAASHVDEATWAQFQKLTLQAPGEQDEDEAVAARIAIMLAARAPVLGSSDKRGIVGALRSVFTAVECSARVMEEAEEAGAPHASRAVMVSELIARCLAALAEPQSRDVQGALLAQGAASLACKAGRASTAAGAVAAGQALSRMLIRVDPHSIPSSQLHDALPLLIANARSSAGVVPRAQPAAGAAAASAGPQSFAAGTRAEEAEGMRRFVQFEACLALANVVSASRDLAEAAMAGGVVRALEESMFEDHEELRRAAVQAMCNLSTQPAVSELISSERRSLWCALAATPWVDYETSSAALGALATASRSLYEDMPGVTWVNTAAEENEEKGLLYDPGRAAASNLANPDGMRAVVAGLAAGDQALAHRALVLLQNIITTPAGITQARTRIPVPSPADDASGDAAVASEGKDRSTPVQMVSPAELCALIVARPSIPKLVALDDAEEPGTWTPGDIVRSLAHSCIEVLADQ